MKAIQINKYGGVEVLEVKDVPKPSLNKDQVLVEVYAASINPIDYKIRSGALKEWMPLEFPTTLGGDFAGVVSELGEEVEDFKVGDEVFGSAIVLGGGSGAFAEFASTKTSSIAVKPKSVNFSDAAALPLTGSSAIQALEEHINLQKGQKILIHGGAGGIGTMAIQLAKVLGGYVATTASTNELDYVKSLGADEVIDYTSQKFEEILKDFDAVYDTVGGEVTNKSFRVLKRGGVIVSMLGQPSEELVRQYGVIAIGQNTKTNTEHLKRLAELVDSGKIKAHIDKEFTLDEVKEAFTYQEQSHPKGKVVFKIKS